MVTGTADEQTLTLEGNMTIVGFPTSGIEVNSVYTDGDYTVDLANTNGVTNIILSGTGSVTFTNALSGVQTQNNGTGTLQITYR